MKKYINSITVILYAAIISFSAYGLYLGHFNNEKFAWFIREDGLVEYLTAIFLFAASIVSVYRAVEYKKLKKPLWVFTAVTLAILFFFGAGEEISWGQRIFNIESGEFFSEKNIQKETNLHNLSVGGTNLNILIFSQLIFIVLVTYVLLRILTDKVTFIRNLVSKFNVPMPRYHQLIVLVGVNAIIAALYVKKVSELHELVFALVFFLIFLNPAKIVKR